MNSKRGGSREGCGRKKIIGKERKWIIPNDIYDISKEKGKSFLWDSVRENYNKTI